MKFILNKDKLTIESVEEINSGSVNYYEADVEYDSSWNGLTIKAILRKRDEDEGVAIAVVGNKMFIDKELLINEKDYETYYIGFVGYSIEEEKKTYQISTKLESFYIIRGAGEIETQEAELPTPTEWELYIAQIEKIANGVSDEITNKVLTDIQPTLDKNVQDMKDYTDKEIATFDFIKIVQELPEVGLVNRMYFVPKTNPETQDLFDEYYWINKGTEEEPNWDWEFAGTKKIEIELTDYVKNTDYATREKAGVVKVYDGSNGIYIGAKGNIGVQKASNTQINGKTEAYSPIVPANLDYAVGSVLPVMTQAEYDALETKDENLYYFIVEE